MTFHRILPKAAVAGLAVLCLAQPALAAPLKIDPARSTVNIVFKQLNVPVDAKFRKFNAQIDFDSAKPEAAKANMEIDIAGFDLGEAEYNREVLKKEWFNAAQFPKATFAATSIKPAAAGQYDVIGKLTIKGKTGDVRFPMTVKKEGAAQIFEGALPIKRLTYNIGEGDWKDTDMVADEVVIKFHVVATP
jgi:polyisoprenoid-binding protein YceI